MIKRTELEILEKAISLADDRGRRIAHLEVMTLNSPTMCAIREPILKKSDTEKQRKYYEEKIRVEVENCKSEMKYEKNKEILIEEITGRSDLNFENALANLINNLWQYLSEEEKQQVKGILE